ncbi:unnamed protein product [Lactuca saligna]|uniref:Elongation factor EFG domain-containing protein n=1 Tax=Lactuca saligna TaxID=75948 RepID=A0AA35ZW99_LACSI|nr:unnamed protein product [Lactuca saligna]
MKKVRSTISSGCLGFYVTSRGEEDGVNDSPLAGLDGILLENMRRENFELSISPSRVMYKIEKGVKLKPIEEVTIEVNEEHVGMVMETLSHRRAEVTNMSPVAGYFGRTRMTLTCPSRGLVGY